MIKVQSIIFLLITVFFYTVPAKTTESPVVQTLNGPIKGKSYNTVFGKDILAFHRIPYIKPPIGPLRFKDPQPVDNWTDVLDCSLPPIPSFNHNFLLTKFQSVIEGDESAIHINAYTESITPEKLRPVMIWIHGGGFVADSATLRTYSPDFLLEKDIVLFTFNYRLGVLGFLSLEDPKLEVPGNAGLKDQTMALRWIKNNCESFGGDPNSITIFGESAGGASVHFHTLSEMSRGLFHKAIIMSGVAVAPWASTRTANHGLKLANLLGWSDAEPTETALKILQNANGTELLNAVTGLIPPEEKLQVFEAFLPIVEPYKSEQCFVPKPIEEMLVDPWSKDIPIIMSHTSNEGLLFGFFVNFTDSEMFKRANSFETLVPKDLITNDTEHNLNIGLRLKQMYHGGESSTKNYVSFINFMSDMWFLRPVYKVLRSRITNPSGPTYLLRFAFDSKRFNHVKVTVLQLGDEPGASHADDLSYLFKNDHYESTGGLPRDSKEFKIMQQMVDLVTNFAATSNPNGGRIGDGTWKELETPNLPYKCLNIDNDLKFIDWVESDRMKVWDELYQQS